MEGEKVSGNTLLFSHMLNGVAKHVFMSYALAIFTVIRLEELKSIEI